MSLPPEYPKKLLIQWNYQVFGALETTQDVQDEGIGSNAR